MQYTTQQLQGGPKYSYKTKIGNWNEDLELDHIQRGNYNAKKTADAMPFSKTLSKYQQSYRQVPWTYRADNNLHWGDSIMIQSTNTSGWLVVDVGDQCPNIPEGYSLTSTGDGQNPGPMTRSVFKLSRVEDMDMFGSDNFIRYGQKVRIEANEYLFRKKLTLCSYAYTAAIKAPVSQKQIACASGAPIDYNSVWVIDSCDPNDRFEMQGEIVQSNKPCLLRHVQTCVFMATDNSLKYKNEFGTEYEVHCHNHSTNYKTQNLEMEYKGKLTSDVPSKFQHDKNVFVLQTAPDASYDQPIDDLSKFNMKDLLRDLKQKMTMRSIYGLKSLCKIFKAIDQKGDCNLDVDDFRWGLMDFGIQVSKDEGAEMLSAFSKDGGNSVNFEMFLDQFRSPVSEERKAAIQSAYDLLAKTNNCVRLDDIAKAFDPNANPNVVAGQKEDQQVYMEFMNIWDTQVKEAEVTLEEFSSFHEDVSCLVESDQAFDVYMKSCFRVE